MAGLYVHIPTCASKCAYCDFYSVAGVSTARLVDALKREAASRRDFFGETAKSDTNLRRPEVQVALCGGSKGEEVVSDFAFKGLDTIYFGGGTPSQLTPDQLSELLSHLLSTFNLQLSTIKEITLEANPEDLTDEYLARLATTGFNRLSVGVQSFDDDLLGLMNRRHTASRARQAVRSAQKNGFDNISIDLIYGIPGLSHEQWRRTLETALEMGVQHISAYHLTIEPNTAFGRWAEKGKPDGSVFSAIAEAESERQYEILREVLSAGGFEQYEISNFALPGRRSAHNSAYWRGVPYLGIGPGAHSFDGLRTRSWVEPDVERYLAGRASTEIEILTDTDLRNERLMVGLRTVEGVDQLRITNCDPTEPRSELRNKFMEQGLLCEKNGRIFIPPENFLLSDYIISSLFE